MRMCSLVMLSLRSVCWVILLFVYDATILVVSNPDKLEQNLALLKEGHQVTPYRNPSTPTAAGGVRQHPPSPMVTSKSCLPLATSGMYVRDC